jgi:hypothetical protein
MFVYVLELCKSEAKPTCVCPHGEEVHARKRKLYTATQDTALEDKAPSDLFI